jgi:hypothetical protein
VSEAAARCPRPHSPGPSRSAKRPRRSNTSSEWRRRTLVVADRKHTGYGATCLLWTTCECVSGVCADDCSADKAGASRRTIGLLVIVRRERLRDLPTASASVRTLDGTGVRDLLGLSLREPPHSRLCLLQQPFRAQPGQSMSAAAIRRFGGETGCPVTLAAHPQQSGGHPRRLRRRSDDRLAQRHPPPPGSPLPAASRAAGPRQGRCRSRRRSRSRRSAGVRL